MVDHWAVRKAECWVALMAGLMAEHWVECLVHWMVGWKVEMRAEMKVAHWESWLVGATVEH